MDDQPRSPLSPHSATPDELRERLAAERRGSPFLLYRQEGAGQQIAELPATAQRFTIGRREGNDVCVSWDPEVSGLHAALERFGREWTLIDDGLSRNGSYVNGSRVMGRRRLKDGDALRLGRTVIVYRQPARGCHHAGNGRRPRPDARTPAVGDSAKGSDRPLPPASRVLVRDAGDKPRDRAGAVRQHRCGQGPDACAVGAIRDRGAPAERKASTGRRLCARERTGFATRPVGLSVR